MKAGKGNLAMYEQYWYRVATNGRERAKRRMREIRAQAGVDRGFGSGDDPLGAHAPAAQNAMLGHLAEIAAGRIDDWMSLIDPTVTYDVNKGKLLSKGGKVSERQRDLARDRALADAEAKARDHAADVLRDNFEAIESGEKSDLADDIAAEFSRDFVDVILEEEKAARDPEPAPMPEPKRDSKPAPTPAPEPAPEPADAPANPVPATREYSGIRGAGRLLVDIVRIPLLAGYHDAKPEVSN